MLWQPVALESVLVVVFDEINNVNKNEEFALIMLMPPATEFESQQSLPFCT